MKKENVAKNFWPLAKVCKVMPSPRDGHIRKVMVQKYLPFTFNTALRNSKYPHIKDDKELSREQMQELTGYFEKMRHTQIVNNLVPYELWKGDQAEPEDMDDGQVSEINVTFGNTRMSGSNVAFYAMGYKRRPQSQIHQFNELPVSLLNKPADIWTTTSSLDMEYHEEILSSWTC
jgi:hypothetical protein